VNDLEADYLTRTRTGRRTRYTIDTSRLGARAAAPLPRPPAAWLRTGVQLPPNDGYRGCHVPGPHGRTVGSDVPASRAA
jgi:hypothetical protein